MSFFVSLTSTETCERAVVRTCAAQKVFVRKKCRGRHAAIVEVCPHGARRDGTLARGRATAFAAHDNATPRRGCVHPSVCIRRTKGGDEATKEGCGRRDEKMEVEKRMPWKT